MKKTLLFLFLLLILNIFGSIIMNNMFSDYHRVSGVINYIVISMIAIIYYIGNLSSKKIIGIVLFPLLYLFCSIFLIIADLFVEGPESPVEVLFLITSFMSSFFEFINYVIGNIQHDILRKCTFAIFNSIGISAVLLSLAGLANYFESKFKNDN